MTLQRQRNRWSVRSLAIERARESIFGTESIGWRSTRRKLVAVESTDSDQAGQTRQGSKLVTKSQKWNGTIAVASQALQHSITIRCIYAHHGLEESGEREELWISEHGSTAVGPDLIPTCGSSFQLPVFTVPAPSLKRAKSGSGLAQPLRLASCVLPPDSRHLALDPQPSLSE